MGKASRRKQNRHGEVSLNETVAHISTAIRKLVNAAGTHIGSDCFVHAELGRALLADLKIPSRIVVGFAAWRVGPGDGDVISHTSQAKSFLPANQRGFAYHAWLKQDDYLIDFTTYQLRLKAAQLDEADHGLTTVNWCPDYLLLPQRAVRAYTAVAQASDSGVAYYEARPELLRTLDSGFSLDAGDLETARLILAHPQVNVLGPNQLPGEDRGDDR